ncbi:MAG: MarC family protein [Deltaproteobacteria bacterium]|nr:MarC family protein [Deltaproteobacteria bacterium]
MITSLFFKSTILFFILLNPFLMSIYLLEIIQGVSRIDFAKILTRATVISILTFSLFVVGGDAVFTELFQVRFESFQIFGGLIFLFIGLKYVFEGSEAIRLIRGDAAHIAGSVAMPFMIGPGTIWASVLSGNTLGPTMGLLSMAVGVITAVCGLFAFKIVYDRMLTRNHSLFERYVDVIGRVSSLWIGAISVQMILSGFKGWGY